jgi:hypothetical protein
MTGPNVVSQWFEAYRRHAMASNAPPIQIAESERVFFAGVWSMLTFAGATAQDEHASDEQKAAALWRIEDECRAFIDRQMVEDAPPPIPEPAEPANYNVRHDVIEPLLRQMGRDLKARMPDGWGFVLLIASFGQQGVKGEGKEGSVFYMSSVDRPGAMALMQDFIKRGTQ